MPVLINRLKNGRRTFSQQGEDLIVESIFKQKNIPIPKITYYDIGCFHPFLLSNTALLSRYGAKGINVDARPEVIALFKKFRPNDINLRYAVSPTISMTADFYVNSKSPHIYSSLEKNHLQDKKIHVSCIRISWLKEFFVPDFLSIDIDGLDLDVLKTMNFKPKVICAETSVDPRITEYLVSTGYDQYAFTGVNSIFVLRKWWYENLQP